MRDPTVRSERDDLTRPRPAIARLLDHVLTHRKRDPESRDVEPMRHRSLKLHLKSTVIQSSHSDGCKVRIFSLPEGLRTLNVLKQVSIGRTRQRTQQPLPAKHKILGTKGNSITPLNPRTQVERVNLAVRADFPRTSELRNDPHFGIKSNQPLHQIRDQVGFDVSAGLVPIQGLGLPGQAIDKRLRGIRLSPGIFRENAQGQNDHNPKGPRASSIETTAHTTSPESHPEPWDGLESSPRADSGSIQFKGTHAPEVPTRKFCIK